MNTQEVADYLGVTPRRVRQLVKSEVLRGVRVGPRAFVFEKSEVERYAAEERRGPGRPPKSAAGV